MLRVLEWFRRALTSDPCPAHRSAPYRPRLEALEERQLLNASRVFDTAGQPIIFIARQDGSLTRFDASGPHLLFDGLNGTRVNWVHAFQDPQGKIGFDVVFQLVAIDGTIQNGAWVVYDSAGSHYEGSGLVTASTAYGPAGNKVIDVVDGSFHWLEYDAAGVHVMNATDRLNAVSSSFDASGHRVLDVIYTNFAGQSAGVYEWVHYDTAGSHDEGGGLKSVCPAYDRLGNLTDDITRTDSHWVVFNASGPHDQGSGVN
jgi:hypothetical protein